MSDTFSLSQMGWTAFFQQQLSLQQWQQGTPGRVTAQHRAHITIITEQAANISLPVVAGMSDLTVGDWLLLDQDGRFVQTLERFSLFSRKSAGSKVALQRIAANINTVFVVCSLNNNFNLNRIERYLALANEAAVTPVVVLTKADCCDDPQACVAQVQALDPLLVVEAVNALDPSSVKVLEQWCSKGNTVALLGSSGVGKSTLVNTLMNKTTQATAASREDDDRGRHTTTGRSLHLMPTGGLLLDTPGMRELQLAGNSQFPEKGINSTFSEIGELAANCRFSNCQHQTEPGCAVQQAISNGQLTPRRLANYNKLLREQARNTASLAEKRDKDRDFGLLTRSAVKAKAHKKNRQ